MDWMSSGVVWLILERDACVTMVPIALEANPPTGQFHLTFNACRLMLISSRLRKGFWAMAFFAHSGFRPDRADWQLLCEHLHNVAGLAKGFALAARPWDADFAQSAYVAGLLHDRGFPGHTIHRRGPILRDNPHRRATRLRWALSGRRGL